MEFNFISGCMPIKNGEKFLPEAIEKLMSAFVNGDELIVIDDCSTDNTRKILAGLEILHPRLRVVMNDGEGLVAALNTGIRLSKNSWIARFDVDDIYLGSRIEKQRELARENVAVIFSDYQIVNQDLRFLGYVASAVLSDPVLLSLISANRTAHPSALINKEYLLRAGGYEASDFPIEDLSLWLRLSNYGELISCPDPLLHYRLSGGSITSNNRKLMKSKRKILLSNYEIFRESHNRVILDWKIILVRYNNMSHPNSRKILLCLDLLRLTLHFQECRLKSIKTIFQILVRTKIDGQMISMVVFWIKRRTIRKLI